MAIHEDLPGIKVTVEVDGASLPEYRDAENEIQHDNPSVRLHQAGCTVINYVESVTGKCFSIKAEMGSEYKWDCPYLGFETYLDGVKVCELLGQRPVGKNKSVTVKVLGTMSGSSGQAGILRRFKFAEIHTTSDDVGATKVNEDKLRLSKVGKITVKVHRYSDGVRYAVDQPEIAGLRNTYDNAVNEKALKGEAKSHGISLGAAERTTVADCMDCKRIDGSDYPIAIFTFKYRSNAALKQLLVIERTPEPEHSSLDDLTPKERQEIEEIARKMRKNRTGNGVNRPVKLEDSPRAHSAGPSRRTRHPKIIDLIEDD